MSGTARRNTRDGAIVRFGEARSPAPIKLICWPHAGGAATVFRAWAEGFAEVDICAVELPGRGMRYSEPHVRSFRAALDDVMPALLRAVGSEPFAFLGHSMGGTLAFEATRWLRRHGRPSPRHLFVVGSPVPEIGFRHPRSPVFELGEGEFRAVLREMNGTPRELLDNEELMELLLPILRADFEVVETYDHVPDEPLDVPITLLLGSKEVDLIETGDRWGGHTAREFAKRVFEGDHFFLHASRTEVSALVRTALGIGEKSLKIAKGRDR